MAIIRPDRLMIKGITGIGWLAGLYSFDGKSNGSFWFAF